MTRRTAASVVALAFAAVALFGCGSRSSLTAPPSVRPHPPAPTPSALREPSRPRATPPPVKDAPASDPALTIAFGGDVHFEGVDADRLAADPTTAVGPMAPVLRAADLSMVNLETAVTVRGSPEPKQFVFRAPPSAFTALRAAGIDVVTEANNHGMDYGVVGLQDSLTAARAAGLPVLGIGLDDRQAYAPFRTTIRGERVAVLAATAVLDDELAEAWTAAPGKPGLASAKNLSRLLAAVRSARSDADLLVVYLHWGTELRACPTPAQLELARALVAAGVDVLVGSHAHLLLGAGYLGTAYVDYGLGNLVFYATGDGPTTQSGVLTLTVQARRVTEARWAPATIEDGAARPLDGAAAQAADRRWAALRACTGLAASPS